MVGAKRRIARRITLLLSDENRRDSVGASYRFCHSVGYIAGMLLASFNVVN